MKSTFYVFGGSNGSRQSNVIASFDTTTKQWKKLGELNEARSDHGVTFHQGQFIVVGSVIGISPVERCTLSGDSIKCTTVEPELRNCDLALMLVTEDYCEIRKKQRI